MPQRAEIVLTRLVDIGIVARGAPMTRMPAGTVNTVFRGLGADGDTVYVRIAPPPHAADTAPSWMRSDALACEAIVLDRLRLAVPELQAPVPIAAGFRCHDAHWLVQTTMPGRPLDTALSEMQPKERQAVWRQLGTLLRHVHAVDGPWFGTPDGRERFRDWPEMVRADARGLLDDALRFGLDVAPFERLLAEIERHEDALGGVEHPALVHSDLDPRHVFVSEEGDAWRITGVIDWEYARYADPFSESLLVELLSRPGNDPDREAVLAGYGIDAALVADAAFHARQRIYQGIIHGWAATDAARLTNSE